MPSPLPNRLPFQEIVGKDHKGCPSRDRMPRQECQAVLGRNLLDHIQLHHQPELVPGPAFSVVVLWLLLGQLQCQVEPWGLAQTPQEPPTEARGLPGQSGRGPRPAPRQPELCFYLSSRLPTLCPKNSFERRVPLVEKI